MNSVWNILKLPRVKTYQNLTPTLRSSYINPASPDESESFIMLRIHNLKNVSLVNAVIRSSPPTNSCAGPQTFSVRSVQRVFYARSSLPSRQSLMKSLLLLTVRSSRSWILIFSEKRDFPAKDVSGVRIVLQEHDTSTVKLPSACFLPEIDFMCSRSVEKLEFLTDPWISSLFQTSAHFFPRLVSWLLRTGDLLIPGSAKVMLLKKV